MQDKIRIPKRRDIIYADDGMKWKSIGEIKEIKDGKVYFHLSSNPKGYREYSISLEDVNTWLYERLYKIKRGKSEKRKIDHGVKNET